MLVIITRRALIHTVDDSIVSMSFHMLLQILWSFETLATEVASMWFQGDMDTDVRSNMVAFDDLYIAI